MLKNLAVVGLIALSLALVSCVGIPDDPCAVGCDEQCRGESPVSDCWNQCVDAHEDHCHDWQPDPLPW